MLRFKIIHPRHRDTELLKVPGMKSVWSPEGVAKWWVIHFRSSKGKEHFFHRRVLFSFQQHHYGDMLCISYSSSAVIKHHKQDNVQQEGFTWVLQFPRYKHPSLSWWQIDITLEQPLRVHILIHWEEAKNTLELSPLNLKACSQRLIFQNDHASLFSLKKFHQIFKHISLCGSLSLKPPHATVSQWLCEQEPGDSGNGLWHILCWPPAIMTFYSPRFPDVLRWMIYFMWFLYNLLCVQ